MSDASFAIGSEGGGGDSFDPSAGGGFGSGFDPFGGGNLGMGDPSSFFGGSGFGGGFTPTPANTPPSVPIQQSAISGATAQPQPPQKPLPQGGGGGQGQIGDLLQSLFGGARNAASPSLQSLAQKGMGWFTGPGDTTGLTTPQPQGPQNDPGSVTGSAGGLSGLLGQLFPNMPPDIGRDWNQIKTDLSTFGQPTTTAGASTGPTGNQATQAVQEPAPEPPPQTDPGPVGPQQDAGITTGPMPPVAAAPESSAAPASPQSAPVSGDNQQPGPGDQVTGSQSSTEAADQGGQYGAGGQQWQNNPMFGLIDLLQGNFGQFMKDMLGQQGVPGGRNYANAPRPPGYGATPGTQPPGQSPMQQVERPRSFPAGPGLQSITPERDPLTTETVPGKPLTTATAAPPSGTPSAEATPQDATAATRGSSTQPILQASAAQRAALGLPPAPGQTPPAAAPAAPPGPQSNAVPTQRVTGQEAVAAGQGTPGMTPQDFNAYADQVGRIESGGNPNARTGSNMGLYQFGPGEMRRYGMTNWRDPAQQRRALQLETNENRGILRRALGREPTAAELYFTHQQGQAGGPALLRAAQESPNTPAYQVIQRYYRSPQVAMTAIHGNIPSNNMLRGVPANQVTAAQFVQMWNQRFARGFRPPTYAQAQ